MEYPCIMLIKRKDKAILIHKVAICNTSCEKYLGNLIDGLFKEYKNHKLYMDTNGEDITVVKEVFFN